VQDVCVCMRLNLVFAQVLRCNMCVYVFEFMFLHVCTDARVQDACVRAFRVSACTGAQVHDACACVSI
jgi:hypothetical protein